MESQRYNKLVSITKRKHTHREQTSGHQWREGKEKGQCSAGGEFLPALFSISYAQGHIIQHREYSQYFAVTVSGK